MAASVDLDPFGEEFLREPEPFHETLREAGPVVFLERYRVWGLARFAEVRAALRDHETYCSSAGVGSATSARRSRGGRRASCWRPTRRRTPASAG